MTLFWAKNIIPLTTTSGKIRVKKRNIFTEYGIPHATKQKEFEFSNYIEWQVGYDIDIKDKKKLELTTLPNINFESSKGITKAFYELSEYLYYFFKWGVILRKDIENILQFLEKISNDELVEYRSDLSIKRTHPVEKEILSFKFNKLTVEYPLLIYKFNNYEWLCCTNLPPNHKKTIIGYFFIFSCF